MGERFVEFQEDPSLDSEVEVFLKIAPIANSLFLKV